MGGSAVDAGSIPHNEDFDVKILRDKIVKTSEAGYISPRGGCPGRALKRARGPGQGKLSGSDAEKCTSGPLDPEDLLDKGPSNRPPSTNPTNPRNRQKT